MRTIANADISLLFGVAGGGSISGESGALIKEQLDSIVEKINKKPVGIKMKADLSLIRITDIRKNLKEKMKQIDNGKLAVHVSKIALDPGAVTDFRKKVQGVLNTLEISRGTTITIKSKGLEEIRNDANQAAADFAKLLSLADKLSEKKGGSATVSNSRAEITRESRAVSDLLDRQEALETQIVQTGRAQIAASKEARNALLMEAAAQRKLTQEKVKAKLAEDKAAGNEKGPTAESLAFKVQMEKLSDKHQQVHAVVKQLRDAKLDDEAGRVAGVVFEQYDRWLSDYNAIRESQIAASEEVQQSLLDEGDIIRKLTRLMVENANAAKSMNDPETRNVVEYNRLMAQLNKQKQEVRASLKELDGYDLTGDLAIQAQDALVQLDRLEEKIELLKVQKKDASEEFRIDVAKESAALRDQAQMLAANARATYGADQIDQKVDYKLQVDAVNKARREIQSAFDEMKKYDFAGIDSEEVDTLTGRFSRLDKMIEKVRQSGVNASEASKRMVADEINDINRLTKSMLNQSRAAHKSSKVDQKVDYKLQMDSIREARRGIQSDLNELKKYNFVGIDPSDVDSLMGRLFRLDEMVERARQNGQDASKASRRMVSDEIDDVNRLTKSLLNQARARHEADHVEATVDRNIQTKTLGDRQGRLKSAVGSLNQYDYSAAEEKAVLALINRYEELRRRVEAAKASGAAMSAEAYKGLISDQIMLEAQIKDTLAHSAAVKKAHDDAIEGTVEYQMQLDALGRQAKKLEASRKGLDNQDFADDEQKDVRNLLDLYDEWLRKIKSIKAEKVALTGDAFKNVLTEGEDLQGLIDGFLADSESVKNAIDQKINDLVEQKTKLESLNAMKNSMRSSERGVEKYSFSGDEKADVDKLAEERASWISKMTRAIEESKATRKKISQDVFDDLIKEGDLIVKNTNQHIRNARAAEEAGKIKYASLKEIQMLYKDLEKYLSSNRKVRGTEAGAKIQRIKDELSRVIDESGRERGGENFTLPKVVFEKYITDVNNLKQGLREAGKEGKTFGEIIANAYERFGGWSLITKSLGLLMNKLGEIVYAVRDIDTAMTELKKVTNETDVAYDVFLSNVIGRSKEVGAKMSDIITATADFARLGYNMADASHFADAAIIYKNVGDGIEDVNEASASIISTMQAFSSEIQDPMTAVDKFNEVGNNFAISSKGIGDALMRSASALAAAGNTIDESIAMVTAANTVVQDPDKVGTTLKTVSMFLRAAKTEAEEAGESTDGMANSVSELRDELLSLTGNKVDIMIDDNTFKSTYQILKELSGVWDELTDVSRANILEMIGGKRNSNVVSAMISDFSLAEEVLATSADSAGSAMKENEKYLDSINGKVAKFQAAFENLAITFVNSDELKFLIDAGTKLLEIVTEIIDHIGTIPAILGSIGAVMGTFGEDRNVLAPFGLGGEDSFFNFDLGIKTKFKENERAILDYNAAIEALTGGAEDAVIGQEALEDIISSVAENASESTVEFIRAQNGARVGTRQLRRELVTTTARTIGLSVAQGLLNAAWSMGISILIGGLIGAVTKAMHAQDEWRQKNEESAQETIDQCESVQSLIKAYRDLAGEDGIDTSKMDQARQIQDDIVELVGDQAKGIDLVNGKLDEQIEKLREISIEESNKAIPNLKTRYRERKQQYELGVKSEEVGYESISYNDLIYQINRALTNEGIRDERIKTYGQGDIQVDIGLALKGKDAKESLEVLKQVQEFLTKNDSWTGVADSNAIFPWQLDSVDILSGLGAYVTGLQESVDSYEAASKELYNALAVQEVAKYEATAKKPDDSFSENLAEEEHKVTVLNDKLAATNSELERMNTQGGSIDLRFRPRVEATGENLDKAISWSGDSFELGDYMTVASQTFTTDPGDNAAALLVTPILPNGELLDQDTLNGYVDEIIAGAGDSHNYADYDKHGILLGAFYDGGNTEENIRQADEFAIHLHDLHEEWIEYNSQYRELGETSQFEDNSEEADILLTKLQGVNAELEEMGHHGGSVDLTDRVKVDITEDNIGKIATWSRSDYRIGDSLQLAAQTRLVNPDQKDSAALLVTPVLPNGDLLDQKTLDQYVDDIINKAGKAGSKDYAKYDEKGILLGVFSDGKDQEENIRLSEQFLEELSQQYEAKTRLEGKIAAHEESSRAMVVAAQEGQIDSMASYNQFIEYLRESEDYTEEELELLIQAIAEMYPQFSGATDDAAIRAQYLADRLIILNEQLAILGSLGGNVDISLPRSVGVTEENEGILEEYNGEDLEVGDTVTVDTQVYSDKKTGASIVVTPILPDGTVLTKSELNKYVKELLGNAEDGDYLAVDNQNLVVGVFDENPDHSDDYDSNADSANHYKEVVDETQASQYEFNNTMAALPAEAVVNGLYDIAGAMDNLRSSSDVAIQALGEMQTSGNVSDETLSALYKLTGGGEDFIDCLELTNEGIQVNIESLRRLGREPLDLKVEELEKQNDALESHNRMLAKDKTKDHSKEIEENTKQIERNQKAIAAYKKVGSNDFFGFDAASEALGRLAELQEAVGESYVMSAVEARKWAEIYPEILAQHTITADGEIQLNADVVNNFIAGKRAEIDTNIKAELNKLKLKRKVVALEIEDLKRSLKVYQTGTMEEVLAEEKAMTEKQKINKGFVDFLIDMGVERELAEQMSIAAMLGDWDLFEELAKTSFDGINSKSAKAFQNMANNSEKAARILQQNNNEVIKSFNAVSEAANNAAEENGEQVSPPGVTTHSSSGMDSDMTTDDDDGTSGNREDDFNDQKHDPEETKEEAKEHVDRKWSDYQDYRSMADTDGDGYVTVTERDAFIEQANKNNKNMAELENLIAEKEAQLASIDAAIAIYETSMGADLKDFLPRGTGATHKDPKDDATKTDEEKRKIEEYIAQIERHNKALHDLEVAEASIADIEHKIENSHSSNEEIKYQRELTAAYRDKQAALHALNNARDDTIQEGVWALRAKGFDVQYNAATNDLYISNLEHVNELVAQSAGEYETVEEATNALRKETEDLIDDIVDLNNENKNSSEAWWEAGRAAKESMKRVQEILQEVVEAASDALDSVQSIYETLHAAADQYAESGYITIDTMQDVLSIGTEYLHYLLDEHGQIKINEESIRRMIKVKTEQLALESALTYVTALRIAKEDGQVEELKRLTDATEGYVTSSWDLVYAKLKMLDLDDEMNVAALHNINIIRTLAKDAVIAIENGNDETQKGMEGMKDGVSSIIEYVMDMIKSQVEQEIEAIETLKDKYSEIIEKKKESLDATREEADYQKSMADKIKEIAKLQAQADALALDNSREAQAKREAILEEIKEKQGEVDDAQADRFVETQKEALDQMEEDFHEEQDKEIEKKEETISSYEKLYELAIAYIEEHWDTLLAELTKWNHEYGDDLTKNIEEAWEQCLAAAQKYGSFVEALDQFGMNTGDKKPGDGNNTLINQEEEIKRRQIMADIIVGRMKNYGEMWQYAKTPEEKEYLHQLAAAEHEKLKELGIEADFDSDIGKWIIRRNEIDAGTVGQSLYDVYGTGERATPYDVVSAMEAISAKWNPYNDPEVNAELHRQAELLAEILKMFGIVVSHDPNTGKWMITEDALDKNNNGKELYDVYGIRTGSAPYDVVTVMKALSSLWSPYNEEDVNKNLHFQTEYLAEILKLFGVVAKHDTDTGEWIIESDKYNPENVGKNLYDIYGNRIESPMDGIASAMGFISALWNKNNPDEVNNALHNDTIGLAEILKRFGVIVTHDPVTGSWVIDQDDHDSSNNGENLYDNYGIQPAPYDIVSMMKSFSAQWSPDNDDETNKMLHDTTTALAKMLEHFNIFVSHDTDTGKWVIDFDGTNLKNNGEFLYDVYSGGLPTVSPVVKPETTPVAPPVNPAPSERPSDNKPGEVIPDTPGTPSQPGGDGGNGQEPQVVDDLYTKVLNSIEQYENENGPIDSVSEYKKYVETVKNDRSLVASDIQAMIAISDKLFSHLGDKAWDASEQIEKLTDDINKLWYALEQLKNGGGDSNIDTSGIPEVKATEENINRIRSWGGDAAQTQVGDTVKPISYTYTGSNGVSFVTTPILASGDVLTKEELEAEIERLIAKGREKHTTDYESLDKHGVILGVTNGGVVDNAGEIDRVAGEITNTDAELNYAKTRQAHNLVAEMRQFAKKWSPDNTPDENKVIQGMAAQRAEQLKQLGVHAHLDTVSGMWIIDSDELNPQNAGKFLYHVYHTGGIVGGGDIRSDEQFALLKDKEWVLTQKMADNLMSGIDRIRKMSTALTDITGEVWRSFVGQKPTLSLADGIASNVNTTNNRPIHIEFGDTIVNEAGSGSAQEHVTVTRDMVNEIARVLGFKM